MSRDLKKLFLCFRAGIPKSRIFENKGFSKAWTPIHLGRLRKQSILAVKSLKCYVWINAKDKDVHEEPSTQIEFRAGVLHYGMVDVQVNRYGLRRLQAKSVELKQNIARVTQAIRENDLMDDELIRCVLEALQKNASAIEMASNEAERSASLKEMVLTWNKQLVNLQNQHKSELKTQMADLMSRNEESFSRINRRLDEQEQNQTKLIEYKIKTQSSMETLNYLIVLIPTAIAIFSAIVSHLISQ